MASSPRDHDADANPSLSRKRPRYSGENLSSIDDDMNPLLYEVVDIDPTDSDNGAVTEIHALDGDDDDLESIMSCYSEAFAVFPNNSAVDQVVHMQKRVVEGGRLPHSWIKKLSVFLVDHVQLSATHDDQNALELYIQDETFFGELADLCVAILNRGDDFIETSSIPDRATFFASVKDFTTGVFALSARIAVLLPSITKEKLSRRDSTQGPLRPNSQHIAFLSYLVPFALLLSGDYPCATYMSRAAGLKRSEVTAFGRQYVSDNSGLLPPLVETLDNIARHAREVQDGWHAIAAILQVMRISASVAGRELEALLEIIKTCLLPPICEKHPRALPDGFHEHLIQTACAALECRFAKVPQAQLCDFYERFVKGDFDAVLPEGVSSQQTLHALLRAAQNAPTTLCRMFSLAWTMQTLKLYITSSIMDVRSIGTSLLVKKLMETYKSVADDQRSENPIVQYAARFLRANELARYIFSADSHASLIGQSQDIIGYLGATSTYTNRETDIIWSACTTSVEAEFVKVSFHVLQSVCKYLSLDHLLYIAQMYRDTPVHKLSPVAVDFLPELFGLIRGKADDPAHEHRLATASLSLELLERLQPQEDSSLAAAMASIAKTELAVYASYPTDARCQILRWCTPHISQRTSQATASAEIISVFLKEEYADQELAQLLELVPVGDMIDELCHYVETISTAGRPYPDSRVLAVTSRLEVLVRLLSLTPGSRDKYHRDILFTFLFDSLALDNATRDAAWQKLASMVLEGVDEAATLQDYYLNKFAESLSPAFATPYFLHILFQPLRGRINADLMQDSPPQTLLHPLWKTLVGIALESPDPLTANRAISYICDLLFSLSDHRQKHKVITMQKLFVEQLLDRICQRSGETDDLCNEEDSAVFLRGIDVLTAVLTKAEASQAHFSIAKNQGVIQLRDEQHTSSPCSFYVLVYSPENRRVIVKVHADESSTLSQLESALSSYTGTSQSRIIFHGSIAHPHLGGQTAIQELGVQQDDCMLVAPTYTASSDLDKIWTCSNVVQQTLSAGFDRLAKYVDGPRIVAQRTFRLLQSVRPSASARQQVQPPNAAPENLLPKGRPWRTVFSLWLLRRQLKDLSRLAVVDGAFMTATVQLLVTFTLEEQPLDETLCLAEVLDCLRTFLDEEVSGETGRSYFTQPSALVNRLVLWIIAARDDAVMPPYPRGRLIKEAYNTLLQAGRRCPDLWQLATQNQSFQRLHAQLWLDRDAGLSTDVAFAVFKFCIDRSHTLDSIKYYWPILVDSIPQALEIPARSGAFFDLASTLLPLANLENSNIRGLVDSCCHHLWAYKHTETAEDGTTDLALQGLLNLIRRAVLLLQNNKTTLELQDVGVKIFSDLLFPPPGMLGLRSLLSDESRGIAYDIVKATCESKHDLAQLFSTTTDALQTLCADLTQKFCGQENWLRKPGTCVGLWNLGMTCYMNSLLQQLFSNVPFRQFLFDTPVVDASKQDVLLHVQELFAKMQTTNETAIDTSSLARALDIETDSQEDVHGFYAIFISRLEESMPDEESKKRLSGFFAGTFVSQIKGACGHVSTRVDPFHDISITVKNKTSLHESLDEFVQGEPMQGSNKYKCLTCAPKGEGQLVDAMKRTSLESVPDNLTFCLKRFTWETATGFDDKINDRFEFPDKIDMSVYKQASLDDPSTPVPADTFDLVGVIVHQGSLQFGHYWSYVRFGSSQFPESIKWMYLEDRSAKIVERGIREVQEQCFGGTQYTNGQERSDNAYVLIYRRSSVCDEIEVQQRCHRAGLTDNRLPEVELAPDVVGHQARENAWRCRIGQLFHQHFSTFVAWALDMVCAQSEEIDTGTHGPVVQLAVTHLLRITLNDPAWELSLNKILPALETAISTHVTLAEIFLQCMVEHPVAYNNIWRHTNRSAAGRIARLIDSCLRSLGDQRSPKYAACVCDLLKAQSVEYGPRLAFIHHNWASYFELLVNIANYGVEETFEVLQIFPLETLHRLVTIPLVKVKDREWSGIQELARTRKLDTTPISDYMAGVLANNVDLSLTVDTYMRPSESRSFGDTGVSLLSSDVRFLTEMAEPKAGAPMQEWLYCHLVHSKPKDDWTAFGPGKLLSVLMGPRVQDRQYKTELWQSMLNYFDVEEHVIARILHMSLHYCVARGDEVDTANLVAKLAAVLTEWDAYEGPLVDFMEEAMRYAPMAVYQCIFNWAPTLLESKAAEVRDKACTFLCHNLIGALQTSTTALDSSRMAALLLLTKNMCRVVTTACERKHPSDKYEQILIVLARASVFFAEIEGKQNEAGSGLLKKDEAQHDDDGETLAASVDEAQTLALMVEDIEKLFQTISDWRLNSPAAPPNDEQGPTGPTPEDENELGSEEEDEEDYTEEEELEL